MALILNIDTALETASACLSRDGNILALESNDRQQDHAAWLHPCIERMMQFAQYRLQDLQAVSVSIGPGSYTGLRVGLSAAKGICYALNIPLISINTLRIMAYAIRENDGLLVPMIDARRDEVFTAIFDKEMTAVLQPSAHILHPDSYSDYLMNSVLFFTGSGAAKWKKMIEHQNARFVNVDNPLCIYLSELAVECYGKQDFADLAYVQPMYVKEFHSTLYKK